MADSQTIRRQVGKGQLPRHTGAVCDVLADYELTIDNVLLNNIDSNDSPMLRKDCLNARSNLLIIYTRLERDSTITGFPSLPRTRRKKRYSLSSSTDMETTAPQNKKQLQFLFSGHWISLLTQLKKNSRFILTSAKLSC
ncbi:hypothetical protein Y032_0039g141 [Ancylostoma ceylanicum]|uniref:Uncharacterized protein n=1 Tax=Ancylostoma ceylanicum TaxID=53326 RepID=A0A016UIT9_9BILA|nr:hypothetical protein Y032_0039g141 [Ancylostoma ceylanicum]